MRRALGLGTALGRTPRPYDSLALERLHDRARAHSKAALDALTQGTVVRKPGFGWTVRSVDAADYRRR